jgi:hypothetical protein
MEKGEVDTDNSGTVVVVGRRMWWVDDAVCRRFVTFLCPKKIKKLNKSIKGERETQGT